MKEEFKVEYEFDIQLDDGVVTLPMKVEKWAKKQVGPMRLIALELIVPLVKYWWVELKTAQTMGEVDVQAKTLVDSWETEESKAPVTTTTVIEDPENPFGFSEIRIKDNRFET